MKSGDRALGMHRPVTRRDILHGAAAAVAGSLLPGGAAAGLTGAPGQNGRRAYPPALTGLRGSHVGSYEIAHKVAREGWRGWEKSTIDGGRYDLVVVGAGLSGLSAAYFFRQRHPGARILIIDNHDDFGGHAKRNEFQAGGRTVIGYGGSQSLEAPSRYPGIARHLLQELNIDLGKFSCAYDQQFFRRNGLHGATFFDRERWGSDTLVPVDLGGLRYTLPLAPSGVAIEEAVAAMPLSTNARRELLKLLTTSRTVLDEMTADERLEHLESISYRDFLQQHVGIHEAEVFDVLQALTTDLGAGIEAVPAADALYYVGLPGFAASGLPEADDEEPYIHHFPDGNASLARLLVRSLIPEVASGSTMEDVVLAEFDYARLDLADAAVRLRLNSTVVNAQHAGSGAAEHVNVRYVRDGQTASVQARHCVMACYNAMIPSICPELPDEQRQALSNGLKLPVIYTNVALNNWRAWQSLGVGAISSSGNYYVSSMMDFPVDLGGYAFADNPDEPVIVHMERFPHRDNAGLTKREQAPLGRYELLSTSFETIERNTRQQLAAMLAEGGFDPARDIEGITVNRWPHGYASRDWLEDRYYGEADDDRYSFVQGRQPYRRIAIANSDAAASATVEAAIEQAHRAVSEIS